MDGFASEDTWTNGRILGKEGFPDLAEVLLCASVVITVCWGAFPESTAMLPHSGRSPRSPEKQAIAPVSVSFTQHTSG